MNLSIYINTVFQYKEFVIAGILLLALVLILFLRRKKKKPTQRHKKNFVTSIKAALLGSSKELKDIVPELEEILLTADVGITATEKLINKIIDETPLVSKENFTQHLKQEIKNILIPKDELRLDLTKKPYVIYLAGVNGSGKTTTIGKLACQFKNQGQKVMLIAADTFRAAAIDQLKIWAEKNQVAFVGGKPQADPSSVIIDGLRSAKAKEIDIVLVDTAGRLQTKTNLMNELKKMVRMSDKELGRGPDQIFLVVDAITGQNGFSQAKIYLEAIPLTGFILTKYDATAKGGIIISIVEQTGLPIRYVGFGEGVNDLKEFDAEKFVEKIFG